MNSSKWIWRITASVSVVITIVLIFGFIYAVKDINAPESSAANSSKSDIAEDKGDAAVNTPKSPNQETTQSKESKVLPPLPEKIKITAIGDSLAKGTGDSTGSGFVRRTIQNLNDSGRKSELLNNLAINGLTTEGLLLELEEKGVQYALKQADLILLSIGGNDLFQGSGILENARAGKGEIDPNQLMNALPKATERLKLVLDQIRVANPDARVIYVGLYNPFADLKELLLPGNITVSTWNYTAQQVVNRDANMVLVPTFDLFQGKLGVYLSSDHFHPNDTGYEAIADRIVQGIL